MAISVAGTVYDSSGVAITGSTRSVGLRVNGGTENLATSNSGDGTFSFASITVSAGDTITLYFNGEIEKGNAVTITDGSTNITGIVLRDNRITLRSDNGATAITNADLADWDNDNDATDMLFTANSGTLSTEDNRELEIVTSETFAPGGNVTINGDTNSACIISGTWTAADGETLLIFGDFDCSGTYTRATTDKITLRDPTATSGETINITWGGNTFTDLQFNTGQSADTFSMTGNCTVKGQLTLTKGTFLGVSTTINAEGGIEVGTNIAPDNTGQPTLAINGTGAQILNGTTNGGGELFNVNINMASGTLTITGTLGLGGNWTHVAGIVDAGTSTVIWNPAGSPASTKTVTMNGTAFNNFTLLMGQTADVLQLQDTMTINGNMNWLKGTFDLQNNTIKIAGEWDDDSVGTTLVVGGSSILEINGVGTQGINLDGKTFDKILISNSSAIVTFDTSGWTCDDFECLAGSSITFEDGQTFTVNEFLTLSGRNGSPVTFRSNLDGTQFIFILAIGTQDVDYVDVKDCDSSLGDKIINSPGGVDSGNVNNWDFGPIPYAIVSVS